jgi:hypothetical protein
VSIKYFACPAHRCLAPGRFFNVEADAIAFAREASIAYRVGYSAWSVRVGKWTLLALFRPEDQPNKEHDQ